MTPQSVEIKLKEAMARGRNSKSEKEESAASSLEVGMLCREKKKEKKKRSLSALPVGTVIKWKIGETERVAYKHEAIRLFET